MFAYCRNNPVFRVDDSGTKDAVFYSDDGEIFSSRDIEAHAAGGNAVGYVVAAAVCATIVYSTQKKKPVNLPSHKKVKLDIDHIVSGHMPDGDRNPDGKKSVFWGLTTHQMIKAIYEAYKYASKLQTQGDRVKIIGTSESFDIIIEMWINIVTDIIETAYPKG